MAYQEVFKRVEMKYVLPPDRMSTVREAMEGRMALDRYGLSEKRTLRRITLDDAVKADETFTILMGEKVEPRKEFIEKNAQYAVNLDY